MSKTKNTGKKKDRVSEPKKHGKNTTVKRDDKGLWLPGSSGNPSGRPPKPYSLTDTLRTMIDEKPSLRRDIIKKLLEEGLKSDTSILIKIWAYLDGNPTQPIELPPADNEDLNKLKQIVQDVQNSIKARRTKAR